MKAKILIIDDEEAVRSALRMIFEFKDYQCVLAANADAGLKMAARESPDVIFLDVKMPQMDGIETLKRLKAQDDEVPVVMLSGPIDVGTVVEAIKLGAFDFIEKPAEANRLLLVARNALEQRRLKEQVATGEPAGEIDAELKRLFERAATIAKVVPAGFQVAGFNRALDVLLADVRQRPTEDADSPELLQRSENETPLRGVEAPGSLKDFKGLAERAFIVQKLRESRWNISATAAAIGTPRSNLYKKLEQYGISQEQDG